MRIKDFISDERAQAFTELIIFTAFIFLILAAAMVQFGFIQLCRERSEMANYYMGYTENVAEQPGSGGGLVNKTKSLLNQGTPRYSASGDDEDSVDWVESVSPQPGSTSRIKIVFKAQSSIMQKVFEKKTLDLKSHELSIRKCKK
ncbi:MAG: hypothetical protein PHF84_06400 [bacterium]|nr:hypothetical protein [bacterium]